MRHDDFNSSSNLIELLIIVKFYLQSVHNSIQHWAGAKPSVPHRYLYQRCLRNQISNSYVDPKIETLLKNIILRCIPLIAGQAQGTNFCE